MPTSGVGVATFSGSGGLLAGGAGTGSVGDSVFSSGGLAAGGTGINSQGFLASSSGGLNGGGVGSLSASFSVPTATSAGLRAGGIAKTSHPVVTGYLSIGAVQPGSQAKANTGYPSMGAVQPAIFWTGSSGRLFTGGSTTAWLGFNQTATGGLIASGIANRSQGFIHAGTGGLTASGSAGMQAVYAMGTAGGLIASGQANSIFRDLTLVYLVWQGASDGSPIDYTTAPVARTHTLTWTSSPLAATTTTRFGVRTLDPLTGYDDGNVDATVTVTLDASGTDITALPLPPAALTAVPGAAGTSTVRWTYLVPPGCQTTPTAFLVWLTAGTRVNYNVEPAATVVFVPGQSVYSAQLTGLLDGTTYSVGVRASNSVGIETNVQMVTVVGSCTGPLPVITLTGVAI